MICAISSQIFNVCAIYRIIVHVIQFISCHTCLRSRPCCGRVCPFQAEYVFARSCVALLLAKESIAKRKKWRWRKSQCTRSTKPLKTGTWKCLKDQEKKISISQTLKTGGLLSTGVPGVAMPRRSLLSSTEGKRS